MMQEQELKDLVVERMQRLIYLTECFVMMTNIIDGEVEALEILVTTLITPTTITTATTATSIKLLILYYISLIIFNLFKL